MEIKARTKVDLNSTSTKLSQNVSISSFFDTLQISTPKLILIGDNCIIDENFLNFE